MMRYVTALMVVGTVVVVPLSACNQVIDTGGGGGIGGSAGTGGGGGIGGSAGTGGSGGVAIKVWGTAQRIDTNNIGDALSPQVAVDPDGNATVVWYQSDSTGSIIWSNRYTPIGGWGVAVRIEIDTLPSHSRLGDPQVAMGANGNAVAAWIRYVVGTVQRDDIWAQLYTPSTGWGVAEPIETNDALDDVFEGTPGGVAVAMDPDGNATVVWNHHGVEGYVKSVWSNRYTPTGGWGTAELIESKTNHPASTQVAVTVDPNGNATAVWKRGVSSDVRTIWSNRYAPTEGWGVAERIENNNPAPGRGGVEPQVAVDPNGNATVVWQQFDGFPNNIWSNRYTPIGGWGVAESIEPIETNGLRDASDPQVALDSSGNGLAVWQNSDGARTDIWASRYTPNHGWGTAQRIETNNAGDASAPQVALDPSGNGLAVWEQSDGFLTDIWSNRWTPSNGWGTAERIEINNAGDATSAQVALDSNGNGLAVWSQSDGTRIDIWANRFE